MSSRKLATLFIVLCLAIISVMLKVTHQVTDISSSEQREVTLITEYMKIRSLKPVDQFNLNQEGSFIAYVYRHTSCDGGWVITPMYRNSEGVSLFERQATYRDYETGPVLYMLQGEIYETFPDTEMWFAEKFNILKKILGFKSFRVSTVFAFRSFGDCKLSMV